MHALANDTVPLIETKAGQKAKASVIGRAVRAGAERGSYRCTCCGGRCEVRVQYDASGEPVRTSGQCRTPNCIAWED